MKISAKVILDDEERTFEIACGTGENTFKWLGITASQRWALAAPAGSLRRKEEFHGYSENVQFQAADILLPSGEYADPRARLCDYLQYSDEVVISLSGRAKLHLKTGRPKPTTWSSEAFVNSEVTFRDNKGDSSTGDEKEGEMYDDEVEAEQEDTPAVIRSKASFMKIVLSSQMLNEKRISHQVDTDWVAVERAMPHINEAGRSGSGASLKRLFKRYWTTVIDTIEYYATESDRSMSHDNFLNFAKESNMFKVPIVDPKKKQRDTFAPAQHDSAAVIARIFRRASTASDRSTLNLSAFVVALMMCAQVKHNDTLEGEPKKGASVVDAVEELIDKHVLPLARKLDLRGILKDEFCSENVLHLLRKYHDKLFLVFEKYVSKAGDATLAGEMPSTSLATEDFGRFLVDAKLTNDARKAPAVAQKMFHDVRSGVILGRSVIVTDDGLPPKYPYEPVPEGEMSFPEFVEATCRAGYFKYFHDGVARSVATSEGHGGGQEEEMEEEEMTIPRAFILGVEAAIKTLITEHHLVKKH